MTNYIVSFRVSTESMSLADLSNNLGAAGPCSNDKTAPCSPGDFYKYTNWIIESDVARDARLEEHLDSIFERIPLEKLSDDSLPQDVEMSFSIAAFFDDAMCSVYVDSYWLKLLAMHEIQLEVSCYPSNFGE